MKIPLRLVALYRSHYMPHDLTGENVWWKSEEPHYEDYYCLWDTFRNQAVVRGLERRADLAELQNSVTPDRLRSLTSGGNWARIEREMEVVFGKMWISDSPLRSGVATNIAEVYNYYLKTRGKDDISLVHCKVTQS